MKKRILSLILIVMLLPIASLFSACGKEKTVDLSALDDEFNAIFASNQNMKAVDGKFVFDYSKYDGLESIMQSEPYNQIENFDYVYSNIMDFSFKHISVCSNENLNISKDKKEEIEKALEDLKHSITNTNGCINIFAETVIIAPPADKTSRGCLVKFEILLNSYNDIFNDAIYFNNLLSDLYFNNILNNGNPNISAINIANFDSTVVLSNLQSRLSYQKNNLSNIYVKKYIDAKLIDDIAYNGLVLDLNEFNYKNNVIAIDVKINHERAQEQVNAQKEKFYNLSVQAQNLQTMLENDRSKFIEACRNVDYKLVKADSTASAYAKMCVEIINCNHDIVNEYNNVLSQMVQVLN